MKAKPTQQEMESNIMPGKTELVKTNVHSRPAALARSKTGAANTHDKKGGKKSMNIGQKIGNYLKQTGQIK